jgi:hypothetical protein
MLDQQIHLLDPSDDPNPPSPSGPRRRRRRLLIGGAVATVVVALAGFVLVVFQPHKLFIDDRVDEALPGLVVAGSAGAAADEPAPSDDPAPTEAPAVGSAAPPPAAPPPTTAPAPTDPLEAALAEAQRTGVPVAVSSGEFTSLDHPASGQAYLVVQPDGARLLRIENLDTDNGPDLRVVLSPAEVGTGAYGDLIELGRLKGNIGNQNYEIPADLDLSAVRSVVIWCERFSSPFGEAPTVVGA